MSLDAIHNPGCCRMMIGVTGAPASGKSTVLEIFERLGCATLDADRVVHGLYEQDAGLREKLVDRWGTGILDSEGRLYRRAIAEIVFRNPVELEWLNECIHPLVRQKMFETAAACRNWLFCAVPLLFESGWAEDFAWTVGIWSDPEIRLERVRKRGWSAEELRRREAAQLSAEEKLERADFGLINNGSVTLLEEQCLSLLATLRASLESARP